MFKKKRKEHATRKEVESLKESWLKDPGFDLADCTGDYIYFLPYQAELAKFQKEHRERWKNEKQ